MRKALALSLIASFLFSLSFGFASASSMSEAVLAKFAEQERHFQLPTGVLAKIAKLESGGNANAVNPGSTQASGLFQWLASSWHYASGQLYGSPRHPNDRFNPFIATEVTAWSLAQAKSRNGGIVQQAGVDMSVGLYMSHFLGIGGANKFFSAFIQNPNANAAQIFPKEAAANRSVFAVGSGRLVDIVNDFAKKMSVPGVTNITGYNGNYDGDMTGRIMDTRGANLLSQPYRGPAPAPDPTRTYQETYNQSSSPPGSGTEGGGSTGPAASILLAQPRVVDVGDTVLVSWASVGMRTDTLCKVSTGLESIGESNEGTQKFVVPGGTFGTITFRLSCTPGQGLPHEKTATVTVR